MILTVSKLRFSIALIALIVVAGVSLADEPSKARGATLLTPFKHDLKQALVEGLEGGAINAISACNVQAPAIAAALSSDGTRIGRTSHRLRNPANTAPDWVNTVLNGYLSDDANRTPVIITLPNERTGYVEPIAMQTLCVACHGDVLAPDVASRIKELYPDDQATGFEVSDLRGVYWAEFNSQELDAD